jgi:DNA-binding beta-propeller fold protein YncE
MTRDINLFADTPEQRRFCQWRGPLIASAAGAVALLLSDGAAAELGPTELPTGKTLTPTAATGAIFQELDPEYRDAPAIRASQAAAVAVSPDGRLLAILTSGFNLHYGADGKAVPALSTEHVFIFDISGPAPKQLQALPVPNTFQGLAWGSASDRLFASGGKDDTVVEFVRKDSAFEAGRIFSLGHKTGAGGDSGPTAGAMAVSPDGTRLLVANFTNDSVSLIDLTSGRIAAEQDLRPGILNPEHHGEPGGSYPRSVAWSSPSHAYVASERDREVISLAISGDKTRVVRRMTVHGQPVALLSNRNGTRLYAALDNTDQVAIFDTEHDALIEEFNVVAPEGVFRNASKLGGVDSNGLTLTPDESTLLVTNGGGNSVAVIGLSRRARGLPSDVRADDRDTDDQEAVGVGGRSEVVGLVPTGWYPTGVATSKSGATWYVVNGKSPTGPNTNWCRKLDPVRNTCISENPPGPMFVALPEFSRSPLAENGQKLLRSNDEATLQLEKSGLLSFPAPGPLELARLTKQVARNNHYDEPESEAKDEKLFSFLKEHIHHVIYIIKENRTYDQILGDLEIGNGDPRLAIFPEKISPNHHGIARNFVALDNFLVSGEGSWSGWAWSVGARTNDFEERLDPVDLAFRFNGSPADRGLNMAYATSAERNAEWPQTPSDPDVLPGARTVDALDGPAGEEDRGHIWDAALRGGLTVRNYGFFGVTRYLPLVHDPFSQKLKVFFPENTALKPFSDPYYRDWDEAFPDFWRFQEWKREFDAYARSNTLPNLMLVKLSNDHFGWFDRAIDGVNTPETQMADNDYALGLIVESVANSRFANDTLVISIEDDTWDGPDHVNSFRSVALFAGPFVRQRALVSSRYTTVNVITTIEKILGIGPIGLNDALAAPMSEVFDSNQASWSYKAIVPEVLRSTRLPLPPDLHAVTEYPKHSGSYWAHAMKGQDFSGPDRVDPVKFNRALWRGLKGKDPDPTVPARAQKDD